MHEIGERDETVPVFLACITCGKAEIIHVFRDRGLPDHMAWECLDCQKGENRNEGRPKTGIGCPRGMVQAP